MSASTENTGGTLAEIRPEHGGKIKPWKPGQSGNPAGRPRGIASAVRAATSSEERVASLLEIADHGKRDTDRIAANALLLAYGYGKPSATTAPEGYDILEADEITRELQQLTAEIRKERAA